MRPSSVTVRRLGLYTRDACDGSSGPRAGGDSRALHPDRHRSRARQAAQLRARAAGPPLPHPQDQGRRRAVRDPHGHPVLAREPEDRAQAPRHPAEQGLLRVDDPHPPARRGHGQRRARSHREQGPRRPVRAHPLRREHQPLETRQRHPLSRAPQGLDRRHPARVEERGAAHPGLAREGARQPRPRDLGPQGRDRLQLVERAGRAHGGRLHDQPRRGEAADHRRIQAARGAGHRGRDRAVRPAVAGAAVTRGERALLALIVAAGAAIRFIGLGSQSWSPDEGVTVALLKLGFGDLFTALRHSESTPPLYYYLAWLWAKVFGLNEAGLRSLSALAGTLTVPVAYVAGASLVTRRAGLVVAALAAFNPLLVWYSQESRSYALLVLLVTASFAFFAQDRVGWWAAASVAALATHYFAAFVVLPEAVWLAWELRRRALWPLAAVAAAGAALLPL